MNIIISAKSNMAIYEQIVNQIKTAIINKEVVEGDMLPSIRGMAKDLQISVITTKRAYEELEKEGLVYSVSGRGFYVCKQNTELLKEKKISLIEQRFTELLKECRQTGLTLDEVKDMVEVLYDGQEE